MRKLRPIQMLGFVQMLGLGCLIAALTGVSLHLSPIQADAARDVAIDAGSYGLPPAVAQKLASESVDGLTAGPETGKTSPIHARTKAQVAPVSHPPHPVVNTPKINIK